MTLGLILPETTRIDVTIMTLGLILPETTGIDVTNIIVYDFRVNPTRNYDDTDGM